MTNSLMDPRTKKYIKDEIQAKKDRIAVMRESLKEKVEELWHSQVTPPTIVETPGGTPDVGYTTQNSSLGTITSLRQNILGTKLKISQDSAYLQDLDEKLAQLHAEAITTPDKIVETSQLRRAQSVAEKMYSQLEDRYLEAWMTEESVFGNIKAEDPAGLNATPIRPNRQSSIFQGAIIGLGLGISIVVILSFLDSTIRTPDEVESQNVPLLATVPMINHPSQPLTLDATAGADKLRFTPHRASYLDPRSSVAESYRALRTSIQFAEFDKPIQTIAISSSAPQEGKSTTSSNLGIVMAQMGRRTVIVDTDLRRPVLHSVFAVQREPGLTNVLFERATIQEGIKETDIPNLFILPCGVIPPNPAELLGSQRMAHLLEELRTMFDVIILDTPPVVAVTDALILGRLADATLLVARADVTRTDALVRAVESVERSGSRFLGVILNNFNVSNAYGSYYRYYQYYHYYSSGTAPKRGFVRRFLPSGKPTKAASRKHDQTV
jgi:tyrosine-protein kinase Etk/Wzc